MTQDDAPQFGETLWQLAEIFKVDLTKRMIDGYFAALEHVPLDEFQRAARRVIQTATFFPRPAELLDVVSDLRPPGCRHSPMCANAVDCTQRVMAALREGRDRG